MRKHQIKGLEQNGQNGREDHSEACDLRDDAVLTVTRQRVPKECSKGAQDQLATSLSNQGDK